MKFGFRCIQKIFLLGIFNLLQQVGSSASEYSYLLVE